MNTYRVLGSVHEVEERREASYQVCFVGGFRRAVTLGEWRSRRASARMRKQVKDVIGVEGDGCLAWMVTIVKTKDLWLRHAIHDLVSRQGSKPCKQVLSTTQDPIMLGDFVVESISHWRIEWIMEKLRGGSSRANATRHIAGYRC